MRHMDKMEAVKVGELGRPKKCPRRELAETEDTNEINSGEETTKIAAKTEDTNEINSGEETTKFAAEIVDTNEINSGEETTKTAPVPDGNDDGIDSDYITALASEALIASLVAEEADLPALAQADPPAPIEAPTPADAPADANYGVPSASGTKPRRRPRKGVPKRAPLF